MAILANNPCPQGAQSHRTDVNSAKQSCVELRTYGYCGKKLPGREQGQPSAPLRRCSWSVSKEEALSVTLSDTTLPPLKCEHFTHTCHRSGFLINILPSLATYTRFYIFWRSYIYPMLLNPIQSSPTKPNTASNKFNTADSQWLTTAGSIQHHNTILMQLKLCHLFWCSWMETSLRSFEALRIQAILC